MVPSKSTTLTSQDQHQATQCEQYPSLTQDGFNETYVSGTTRADSLVFNIFYHAGSKLAATPDDYQGLYDSAQNKFQGSSIFPTVTLTDETTTPTGTTPTDTDSDGMRDTTEAKPQYLEQLQVEQTQSTLH